MDAAGGQKRSMLGLLPPPRLSQGTRGRVPGAGCGPEGRSCLPATSSPLLLLLCFIIS